MDHNDSGPRPVKTTPQVERLELPASLKKLVEFVGAQLIEFDAAEKRYALKPALASAVCLAIAEGDPGRGAQLLERLCAGLDDLNEVRAGQHTHDFPII